MPYQLRFASGTEQAVHAGLYFHTVANDLVDDTLAHVRPNHYRVGPGTPPRSVLRFWSHGQPASENVLNIAAVAAALQREASALLRAKHREANVLDFFQRWLGLVWPEPAFFLEKLKARDAFTQNERLDMSLAVLGGRLAMFSTGALMFVQQAPDLYGMAVAERGSYLVEVLRAEPAMNVARR